MKRKFLHGVQFLLSSLLLVFTLSFLLKTNNVIAESDNEVDMSTYSIVGNFDNGTVIAPYDGIALVTTAATAGEFATVKYSVNTSKSIAIEMKNFTKDGVNVSIKLGDGTNEYLLDAETVSYLVRKSDNKLVKVTGDTINLSTTGASATGFYVFNGYVVIANDKAITEVTISMPIDTQEKVFIGKTYEIDSALEENATIDISTLKVLYAPTQANFTSTNTEKCEALFLKKDEFVNVLKDGTAKCSEDWEQSRIDLNPLDDNGLFDLNNYKYLVMDFDFSKKTAQTSIGICFFRHEGNKYNADRCQPAKVYGFNEDGTSFTQSAGLGGLFNLPAGFKGKLMFDLSASNMLAGANFTDADPYTGKVFKQLMLYFAAGKNAATANTITPFKMYFTNSDLYQVVGDNAYTLQTNVNNKEFGSVTVNTETGIVVTPTANENYKVKSVKVNGVATELEEGKLIFESLTENKIIDIEFGGTKVITFNNDIENVEISCNLETIYNSDDCVFHFEKTNGYTFKSVKMNGEEITLDINGNYEVKNIQANIDFAVELEKLENIDVNNDSFVLVSEYPNGTIWMPFDGVAVISKSVTDTTGKTVKLSFPVTTNKNLVLRVGNMHKGANSALKIELKKGETVYSLNTESKYYLVNNGAVIEKTGALVKLDGSSLNGGYFNFGQYVIIPNTNEIDTVEITVDITTAQKLFFGNIYKLDTIGTEYTENEADKLYTPSATNFEKTADQNLAYVEYLEKNSYVVVGTEGVTDGWEQSRVLLGNLEDDETFDISKWTYLVMNVDFSNRKDITKIGFVFFRQNGNKWNADRCQPKEAICVGDDGSYAKSTAGLGGLWTIPTGFKGKIYLSLSDDNMVYGANFAATDSKTKLYKEFMLYSAVNNNANNVGAKSSLNFFFTSEVLPTYETVNLTLVNNDSKKGTATISTHTEIIKGSNVKVVVTPKAGYLIDKVLVGGVEVTLTGNEYLIENVQENKEIIVSFTNDPTYPKFKYTITADEHVIVSYENTEIPFGTDAKFRFDVDFGYIIKEVKVNGVAVELTNNQYIVPQVEADVTIEVSTQVIPDLTGDKYDSELGKSFGSHIKTVDALQNFYADFDSIFLSGILYSRDVAKEICPQPYIGLEISNFQNATFNATDMILIQYRQYHTQSASASGNGIKITLKDANGKQIQVGSGTKVYLIDNEFVDGQTVYTNAATYVSGGMIFTPFDFSGYLAIPMASFADNGPDNNKEGFDFANVQSLILYTDYRWWSDSGSRYAIGNIYQTSFDSKNLTISEPSKIWNVADGTYTEYFQKYNGKTEPFDGECTFSDFAFTKRFTKGMLYFFDFEENFSKYTDKGWTFSFSKDMLQSGYYDFRKVNIIRLYVENDLNKVIPFGLTISSDGNKFVLADLNKIVYFNTVTNEAQYGAKEIPANFKGYIDIYFGIKYFNTLVEGAEFTNWIDPECAISLANIKDLEIENGSCIKFNASVLLESYELEYETINNKEYTITYVLDGGENNSVNPEKYNALAKVTLADATKVNYEFQGWYITADYSTPSITSFEGFTGDITLYAKFGAHFTVTYDVTGNGNIRPDITTVEAGETVSFLIFPDDGYEIASVTVNGEPVALDENDSFTVENIQESLTIKVVFIVDPEYVDPDDNRTTQKSTQKPTQKPTTKPTQTNTSGKKKTGCKSTFSLGIALIPTLFGALAIAKKKREE